MTTSAFLESRNQNKKKQSPIEVMILKLCGERSLFLVRSCSSILCVSQSTPPSCSGCKGPSQHLWYWMFTKCQNYPSHFSSNITAIYKQLINSKSCDIQGLPLFWHMCFSNQVNVKINYCHYIRNFKWLRSVLSIRPQTLPTAPCASALLSKLVDGEHCHPFFKQNTN